jgi:hypothetical protein
MSNPICRAGQRVPDSGVYAAVDQNGAHAGREVTCTREEMFPPTVGSREYGYRMIRTGVPQSSLPGRWRRRRRSVPA